MIETPALTSTTALTSRDFGNAKDFHVEWTAGALRHVIKALDGVPVALVVSFQTGHTVMGVVLVGLRTSFHGDHPELIVRYPEGHETAHLVFTLGETIIPLAQTEKHYRGGGPKWEALKTYAEEKSAAVLRAQREHGETEGRAWGVWCAKPALHHVYVEYTPSTGNPHFADKWGKRGFWTYGLETLADAGV